MNAELRSALTEFLAVVLRILMHSGNTSEHAALLESWQELYERLLVDPD